MASIDKAEVAANGASWRGSAVPPVLAMLFDQLMAADLQPIYWDVAARRYLDITLTVAHGASAKPPQIIIK